MSVSVLSIFSSRVLRLWPLRRTIKGYTAQVCRICLEYVKIQEHTAWHMLSNHCLRSHHVSNLAISQGAQDHALDHRCMVCAHSGRTLLLLRICGRRISAPRAYACALGAYILRVHGITLTISGHLFLESIGRCNGVGYWQSTFGAYMI